MADRNSKKSATPKNPPPTYIEMICNAIGALKERNGCSHYAIGKYIKAKYNIVTTMNINLKMALKQGVESGILIQPKGTHLFKLNQAEAQAEEEGKKKAAGAKEKKRAKKAVRKAAKKAVRKATKEAIKKAAKEAAMKAAKEAQKPATNDTCRPFGSMGNQSQSDLLRQLGNNIYRTVTVGLSPVLQKGRLEKAMQYYSEALECSASPRESAAANKNLAMVSWKLATLESNRTAQHVLVLHFYKEALKSFSKAWKCGQVAKNGHLWSDNVVQKMHQCLQESLDLVTNQPDMWDEKNKLMIMACQLVPTGSSKAEVSILYVEFLLSKAINLLQNGVFSKSKSILYDCHQPLEEARRCGRSDRVMSEVRVLHEDVVMQTSVVEARQALRTADDLKQNILMSEENLSIDMVWEVLDWYKKAILLTREKDVELEAIAMSRMGVIYDSILKLRFKARPYFKGAITLAHSLHPRVLTNEEWYQVCAQTLESYQIETVAEETRAWMKEREETLKKLEPQIKKFKYIDDNYECLKYIYKNHPPKKEEHKLPDDLPEPSKIKDSQVKKCLQKAILHYHPDHNSKEKFGKEWHVLCEEIIKVFTHKYNCMKGV
ncbi:uncharacterized protein LOC117123991 [Anneissia japonica]|uniref:uncharacterized protein LOC117123991 n=1 Tax=Anneissia japonica TaxID=1529436 RepID=UPI0014254D11|nr:uncharacterized protein LOC117123991 [Anneissia japonica]